jgi:hypothetical protein
LVGDFGLACASDFFCIACVLQTKYNEMVRTYKDQVERLSKTGAEGAKVSLKWPLFQLMASCMQGNAILHPVCVVDKNAPKRQGQASSSVLPPEEASGMLNGAVDAKSDTTTTAAAAFAATAETTAASTTTTTSSFPDTASAVDSSSSDESNYRHHRRRPRADKMLQMLQQSQRNTAEFQHRMLIALESVRNLTWID